MENVDSRDEHCKLIKYSHYKRNNMCFVIYKE